MAASDLTRAQYSGIDFNTALDDLRSRIQVQFASTYTDFAVSSLGIMLLDSVAFGIDTLSFYLDRRATDSYLSTARTRKAVARLTKQLGYKMRPATASSTDLDVSVQTGGISITVPKGFKFKGPNSLIFESGEAVIWAGSETGVTKSIPVYEGETIAESFVSDGTPNQVFQLSRVPSQKFIAAGTVKVLVNGTEFKESEFITFDSTDQFECGYNDDPPTLRFGDGRGAGNIPTTGATVSVTYVASMGLTGMVPAGTIVKEQNPLVISFQPIKMTVNNQLGSVGGSDPEDLDHAKLFAPQVFKSRDVAVTGSDYEALSGAYSDPLYGRVAVARALSSRSAASDTYLTGQTATVRTTADLALPVAGGAFQLSGQASVASGALSTLVGTNTKFNTELAVND